MSTPLVDLTGMKIGRLFVKAPVIINRRKHYECQCDCGNEFITRHDTLAYAKDNRSCGCVRRKIRPTGPRHHGLFGTPENRAWKSMIQRCHDPNSSKYSDYGGRGIRVCDKWRSDFTAFLEDVGHKPNLNYQIERIDNDGNYEPGNCRWATPVEQARNKRDTRFITANGQTKPMCSWADETGISIKTIHKRLKDGWSEQDSVTVPVGIRRK